MDSFPLKDARTQLGKIHSAAVHGHRPIQITRNGSDPVVVISRADYDRLVEAAHYKDMADAVARLRDRNFTGYTKVSRDDLAGEDWLA